LSDTAWIYAAVSSAQQRETLPDQEGWALQAAEEHGWTVTRVFRGVSTGKGGTRALLESLLTELRATPKAERPARVLMNRLDRLGRGDGLDAIAAFAEIRKLGVLIHDRIDGDRTVDTAMDAIRPILELITGAFENIPRRDKTLNAHRKRIAAGQHWVAPFGMRVTSERTLEPAEPDASIVREVFALRAQGWGYNALGRRFRPAAPARSWARSFVHSLLHRDTYRGAVVDNDLFDRVQQMVGKTYLARATQRFPWPLAKALRCGACGHILHGEASGRKQWRTRYYVCDNLSAHSGRILFRADHIERQFIEQLGTLAASPALVAEYRQRPAVARASLNVRLTELEGERRKIEANRQYVWTMKPYVDEIEVAEQLAKLRTEEARVTGATDDLRREIAATAATEAILRDATAILARMAEQWSALPVEAQQRAARALAMVFPIVVHDDDPTRIRGPKARRNSARGRVEVCAQSFENMREINSLRDAQMAQRKADDGITKKFIESIGQ
jgi:DNA invertase Pin-like site-specific DNA recombinase